jgi:hypothetical protein
MKKQTATSAGTARMRPYVNMFGKLVSIGRGAA